MYLKASLHSSVRVYSDISVRYYDLCHGPMVQAQDQINTVMNSRFEVRPVQIRFSSKMLLSGTFPVYPGSQVVSDTLSANI